MEGDDANSEADLRRAVRSIERDVPLDSDAALRVEARLVGRFDEARAGLDAAGPVTSPDVVEDWTAPIDTRNGRRSPDRRRPILWLLRAAVVLLVGGVVAAVTLWPDTPERDELAPAKPDRDSGGVRSSCCPSASPRSPRRQVRG